MRTVKINIDIEIKTENENLSEIYSEIKKGILRGLDIPPHYFARPKDVTFKKFHVEDLTPPTEEE